MGGLTAGRFYSVAQSFSALQTSTRQRSASPMLTNMPHIEQFKQRARAQNGGVDPQEPPPAAAAGGSKKGGGRNEQKVNQDRKQSAADKLKNLKKKRDQLKSKPNKSPKDKADLQKAEKAINREIDRQKKSENHSMKDKGSQR